MTTVAARPSALPGRPAPTRARIVSALTRRALRDARGRTLGFAYLFAAIAYLQPVAYRHTYATLAERIAFARSFGANQAVVLFYGKAYDLLTVGGYAAWRVGGSLSILAAVFGLLAAVRALRAEEESGRAEVVLAGPVTRAAYLGAVLASVAVQIAILWLAVVAGGALGGLSLAPSAYLALAIVSCIPVLAGVGALVSQLAATRRLALELGSGVLAVCFAARVIADTTSGAGALRWLTPLGWSELARPFTGAAPLVLLAPLLATGALMIAALALARARDIDRGLLGARERRHARLALLGTTTTHALREERTTLLVWVAGMSAFAFVYGVISKSISGASIPASLQRALVRLGTGPTLSARAYLAFAFSLAALLLSLLAVAQVGAARREELEGRAAQLLGLPVSRRRWLLGRLGVGAGALGAVAICSAVAAWAGAALQGESIPFGRMLEAGLNCLPVALLFGALTALAYALAPAASAAIGYGLVAVAFLWQEVGALLGAPHWLVSLTPFAHVALVPVAALKLPAALIMIALSGLAAAAALVGLERRDVVTA